MLKPTAAKIDHQQSALTGSDHGQAELESLLLVAPRSSLESRITPAVLSSHRRPTTATRHRASVVGGKEPSACFGWRGVTIHIRCA